MGRGRIKIRARDLRRLLHMKVTWKTVLFHVVFRFNELKERLTYYGEGDGRIMNKTLEIIRSRRSIRQFKEEQISDDELNQILEAAIYAPNAERLGDKSRRGPAVTPEKRVIF